MILLGVVITTDPGGTFRVTTQLAPIIEPSPMVIPPSKRAPT
jgi:hypothetical protein